MTKKIVTLEDKIKNTRESILLYQEEIESCKNQIEELYGKIDNIQRFYIKWSQDNLEQLLQEQKENEFKSKNNQ